MKFMIKEFCKQKKLIWIYIFSMILSAIGVMVDTVLIVQITNTLNQPEKIKENLIILFIMMMLSIFAIGLNAFYSRFVKHYSFTFNSDGLMQKISESDINMFTKYSVSNILHAADGVWWIGHIADLSRNILNQIISIIAVFGSMWYLGGNIILPIIVIYFIVAIMMVKVSNKFSVFDELAEKLRKDRAQMMDDFIMGFQEFKSFGNSKAFINKYKKVNADTLDAFIKRDRLSEHLSFVFQFGNNGLMFAMVIGSLYLISKGIISPASGISLVILSSKIVEPIDFLMNLAEDLSDSKAKMKYYKEICEYKNLYDNSNECINLDSFNDKIEIDNIKFNYEGNSSDCINNLSMEIHKGEKIGICGLSGAGKSTLFKLLNKLYNYRDGKIKVDGIPLKNITDASWRKHVGVVNQENFIFPGTIEDNIVFGTNSYTEYELIESCKSANLYNFIMSLPDKFKTEVGPRGLKLSGGQKQRIAIARMFMKNPDIILLDEATSALDNINENIIKEAIDNLSKDKTVITIAHRITTIENCDRIYVMKNGKIVERGSYDQLVNDKGSEFNRIKEGRA